MAIVQPWQQGASGCVEIMAFLAEFRTDRRNPAVVDRNIALLASGQPDIADDERRQLTLLL